MATLRLPVTSKDHIQGDESARVLLVEYGDYECPHCGRAYPIVKEIQKRFGTDLAFVFRNFPLKEIHPIAEAAAEAAEFAAAHRRYWEMHDGIFENQDRLDESFLMRLAESLKLSAKDLGTALSEHKYAAHVKEDFVGGVRNGVNGTPTFFINGQRHDGPFEFEDLSAAITAALS